MNNQLNITDEELMLLLKQGSEPAFNVLYMRYKRKLVHFAQGYLGSREISEDLVQDIFLKLIKKPHLFKDGNSFASWIFSSVKNTCLNKIRDEKKRTELRQHFFHEHPTTEIQVANDYQKLRLKINEIYKGFSEKEKLIFTLRFELELSLKECAEIAEIPEGSVKSCFYYLLKKMAPKLKEFYHEKP